MSAATSPEPQIRGRAWIELLAHMDEFERGLLGRVRDHVPPEDLALLSQIRPTDWVAASHTRPVIDGIVTELGERTPLLWASLIRTRMLRTPLLGGFFEMLVRLGDVSPARFIKSMPRGWGNAYRDWGEPRIMTLEAKQASLEFVDVPAYLFEHRQHWLGVEGVVLGLIEAGHANGRVELDYVPGMQRVVVFASW